MSSKSEKIKKCIMDRERFFEKFFNRGCEIIYEK